MSRNTLLRRIAVALSIALLVVVAACSSSGSSGGAASGNGGSTSATGTCPAHETKAFAKTRFVADAGIAAGVFKHWIYTPYRQGSFQKGAQGRVKNMVKAGVAAAFVANRLNAAKNLAKADPALCNHLIAPIQRLSSSVSSLIHKGKSGNIDPSDVTSANNELTQFRSSSSGAGASFQDKNVPVPGL